MSAAQVLGEFVATLRWDDVDAPLREKVKAHVLDTLGVTCAGVGTAPSDAAEAVVRRWGGTAESSIVARDWRAPAPHAAFLNAFHARLHTFDDVYEAGPLHPGSAVVSAALAVAEANCATGAEFLTAVLAGYEVAVRVSLALGPAHYGAGFHNTGTCNVVGACAAAARAISLDGATIAGALGLAGEAAAGFRQYQVDGSMADSSLNGARAAQAGVTSAELARAGLSGPLGILDGRWGILSLMSAQPSVERLTDGLGSSYAFAAMSLKPYPSCRFTHGPIDALLRLRAQHRFAPADISAIEIATFGDSIGVSDQPDIRTRLEGILSHQYNAALALVDGRIVLESFDDARRSDPVLLALAKRVRVVLDRDLQEAYPAKWGHRVSVKLTDGRSLETLSDHPPGGVEAPLSWDDVVAKFTTLAVPRLGAAGAQRIVAIVADLDDRPDVVELGRELRAS